LALEDTLKRLSETKPKRKAIKPTPNAKYEERIVLFVDFLGFKSLVAETIQAPCKLQKILNALERLSKIKDDDGLLKSQGFSQFSDCVVLSYRVDDRSAIFWLLSEIELALIDIAEAGYLLRGAVTIGELYHSNNLVVGPALVEAYKLESTVAKYPRILIDSAVIRAARTKKARSHAPAQEVKYIKNFMTKDEDGNHYIDYISYENILKAGGTPQYYPGYLSKIAKLIDVGLQIPDTKVHEKYQWLLGKYEAAKVSLTSSPAAIKGRTSGKFSEFFREVDNLPSFPPLHPQLDPHAPRV
jgi:hypothetical protein